MPRIAHDLSDADIRAVAVFYAGMPAPGPRDADVATPWRASGNAVVSGPRPAGGAKQESQGVGTEQGAPLTGGGQGPGGGGATSGGGAQGSPTGRSQTGTSVGPAASAPR